MEDSRPIGLTGTIGAGKSTVLSMLADLGLKTASSDSVAREIFHDVGIQEAVARRLGHPPPVSADEVRRAILSEPEMRRWLNRLMHPLVGERLSRVDADVVEVPLLFEACLQSRYREVWTVSCDPHERERRLRLRYGPAADVSALGRWQLPQRAKEALADLVVRTDGPPDNVLTVLKTEAARCFPAWIARSG